MSKSDENRCPSAARLADEGLPLLLPRSNVLRRTYEIRSYEVDAAGRLSVLALFNYLQDAASAHARRLGVAIDDLLAENRTWVLARLFLQMSAYPKAGDKIRIATWPSGVNRVNAYRNFLIATSGGKPLGGCLSSWLVIDLLRRRPMRMDSLSAKLRPQVRSPMSLWPLGKIGAVDDVQGERKFSVRYRDLDVNQHVNNVSYVEWLLESLPRKVSRRQVLAALHITFLSEAFADQGGVARWRAKTSAAGFFEHSIRNVADDRELVRAQSVWRPRAAGGDPAWVAPGGVTDGVPGRSGRRSPGKTGKEECNGP